MKKLFFAVAFAVAAIPAFSTITIVDINGAGQFTSIQLAIDNSLPGDTIQVWPGTYNGAININKNVVLQGSGYENTIITSASTPTIMMSNGLIKWFMISSTYGIGLQISNGHVHNCVFKGAANYGIYCNNGTTGYIQNCVILNNGSYGIYATSPGYLTVVNCIGRANTNTDFYNPNQSALNLSYSDGSQQYSANSQGVFNSDPIFVSTTNYHLSTGSPCFDTGQPSLSDPDGSISDIGYFGGPDCPIFPVVYQMTVSPNGNNINIQAKARANY
ncbi:MAG: hypothetical protein WCP32_16880 [Bacteroidota bacterium]